MAARIKMTGLEIECDNGQQVTRIIADSLTVLVNVAAGESLNPHVDPPSLPPVEQPPRLPAPEKILPFPKRKYTKRAAPPAKAGVRRLIGKVPLEKDPAAPAAVKNNRKRVSFDQKLICVERPGQEFTIAEAAKLAGVTESTVRISLSPSLQARGCGGLHFRRASSSTPIAPKPSSNGKPKTPDETLADLRRQREDKTLGLQCARCGWEQPTEASDRSKSCPKCNSRDWEHKNAGPLTIPE